MFDDGDEEKKNSNATGGNGNGNVGVSNDDDELLLDNYFVKVNEVFNPEGEITEENKLMMQKASQISIQAM